MKHMSSGSLYNCHVRNLNAKQVNVILIYLTSNKKLLIVYYLLKNILKCGLMEFKMIETNKLVCNIGDKNV